MITFFAETKKATRQGLCVTGLRRTILKCSIVVASLVVLGTGAALANEGRKGSDSAAASEIDNRGVSQASSAAAGKVAVRNGEARPVRVTYSYVPSYRTGLKWKQ